MVSTRRILFRNILSSISAVNEVEEALDACEIAHEEPSFSYRGRSISAPTQSATLQAKTQVWIG